MLKIYLTNLGKYNEGFLIGKWVTLPNSNLNKELNRIGINFEYEEFFISDWECTKQIESILDLKEYSNIFILNENLKRIEQLDLIELEKVESLIKLGNNLDEALNKLDEIFYFQLDTSKNLTENEKVAYGYIEIFGGLNYLDDTTLEDYFLDEDYRSDREINQLEPIEDIDLNKAEIIKNENYYFDYESYGRDLSINYFINNTIAIGY